MIYALLDHLLFNRCARRAGQTRKAFAKKTVLIGFPNIPYIRLTGTRQKNAEDKDDGTGVEKGGGGGAQRVHLQLGIFLMLIIM